MFRFLYALLALVSLVPAAIAWWRRPDLRPLMLQAGIAGGVLEMLGEYWYLQDYWQPGTVFGFPAPEDFAYGFGTTAFTVTVIPLWKRWRYDRPLARRREQVTRYAVFLAIFAGGLQLGTRYTPLPSIWVASLLFFAVGVAGCWLAYFGYYVPVLALATGAFMAVFSLVGYAFGLGVLVDGDAYLRQTYLLAGTAWDIRIVGVVPLDEVVWNATRAFGAIGLLMWLSERGLRVHD